MSDFWESSPQRPVMFLDRVRQKLRLLDYAIRTEEAYVGGVSGASIRDTGHPAESTAAPRRNGAPISQESDNDSTSCSRLGLFRPRSRSYRLASPGPETPRRPAHPRPGTPPPASD